MRLHSLMADIIDYPRSLTGDGVRQTLRRLQKEIPLDIHEVPLPLKAMDWELENEWRFRSARLFDESGALLVDAANCALHCLGYSVPFRGWVSREELEAHLVVGPEDAPDVVPYSTSYYEPNWGLSVSWNQHRALRGDKFLVAIDTELFRGALTYADLVVPGETSDEVMIDSYVCHPAGLANNETSGPVVLTELVRWWMSEPRRYTLRAVLAPETIGMLVYLSRPGMLEHLKKNLKAAYVLTCLGGGGGFSLQEGRTANYAQKIAGHVLKNEYNASISPWSRRASDERQLCSPGVDLPACSIRKTPPPFRTKL